jgi:CDP-3, 6-dideoxy-D-glycero-L-glycero-4-hexulose-4-reductase
MKVLISGSSGYVGRNLVLYLSSYYVKTYEINRDYNGGYILKSADEIIWRGSLSEMSRIIEGLEIDCLVNTSASTLKTHSERDTNELIFANIFFANSLAQLALTSKIPKYIYLTTYSAYDDSCNYSPQTFYAATKEASENILTFYQSVGLHLEFLHLYDIYGPKQPHSRFLNQLLAACKENLSFTMSKGEQEVNFIHVKDVCSAIHSRILDSAEKSEAAHFCIYSNDIFTLNSVPKKVLEIIQREQFINNIIFSSNYRPREIFRFNPRYPLIPNWEPSVSFEEAILEMWNS